MKIKINILNSKEHIYYLEITIIRVSNISCNMDGNIPLQIFFLTNATPEGEIDTSLINSSRVSKGTFNLVQPNLNSSVLLT